MKVINFTASRHAVFYSPLIALISEGFLEKYEIKGVYHTPSPNVNVYEKISCGEIDVSQSAVSQSWNLLEKNISSDIKHFALINSRDGFFITSKTSEFDWTDLYNYPFYYVRGGQPEAMLKYGLSNKKIDLKKIKLVTENPLSTEEMYKEFSKSKKSFFHEQGCYPHQLEFDHKGIIVGSIGDLIGPVAFSSLCANEKLIKSDIGLKISKAFEESKKWVQNSDSKIVAESVKSYFPNFDTTSISNAVKDYQDLGTWNKGINISDEEYNKAQEVFKFSNLISKDYKIEDAVLYAEE